MRLSIAAKINFFLLFIFSMVLVFSAAYQAVRERDLILTLIKEQSREQTEAYFDGLNMLMLTGKMDARDTLRGKFLDHAHVEDARIVRGDAVSKQFGPGRETEQVKDEFDELALVGKGSLEVVHTRHAQPSGGHPTAAGQEGFSRHRLHQLSSGAGEYRAWCGAL